jgi:hypothetical protein
MNDFMSIIAFTQESESIYQDYHGCLATNCPKTKQLVLLRLKIKKRNLINKKGQSFYNTKTNILWQMTAQHSPRLYGQ